MLMISTDKATISKRCSGPFERRRFAVAPVQRSYVSFFFGNSERSSELDERGEFAVVPSH